MKHLLLVIFTILITDFYYFPIEFVFLPGVNTKMFLAGIGLVMLGFNLARHQMGQIDKGFLWLSLAALCVSFISYISIVVNNTPVKLNLGFARSAQKAGTAPLAFQVCPAAHQAAALIC